MGIVQMLENSLISSASCSSGSHLVGHAVESNALTACSHMIDCSAHEAKYKSLQRSQNQLTHPDRNSQVSPSFTVCRGSMPFSANHRRHFVNGEWKNRVVGRSSSLWLSCPWSEYRDLCHMKDFCSSLTVGSSRQCRHCRGHEAGAHKRLPRKKSVSAQYPVKFSV